MCGRYTLYGPWAALSEVAGADFEAVLRPLSDWRRYNQAPGQRLPILTLGADGPSLEHATWGLIPPWLRVRKTAFSTFNARAESLSDKPAFREAWRAGRRCLVPASGWFEWRQGVRREACYLSPMEPDQVPLMFAGLWSRTRLEDEVFDSYTIITTEARGVVREVHDRQPRLIPAGSWMAWLQDSKTQAASWLVPEESALRWHRVGDAVGNVRNEGPALIAPHTPSTAEPFIADLFSNG